MQVLEKGEYVGDIQTRFNEHGLIASVSSYNSYLFNDSWHYHINAHISFVLNGGRSEKKNDRYECLPGKAIFYRAGEAHQIIRMHNSTHVNLEIDDSFFSQYDFTEQVMGRIIPQTPDASFLMLKIMKEMQADDQFTGTSVHMLLLDFLHSSARRQEPGQIPEWLIEVRSLLHDRWQENVNLTDLAKEVGIHPVTISHYFPQYFSCTLGAYMRKLKVEQALHRLKSPGTSLTDIAYECGFFDQSHFIKTFKQLTGFLPAYYQKM